jgi:hypothetical protein
MDASRLTRGEQVAAIAGIALIVIMFLPWFGIGGVAGEALEQAQDLGFAPDVSTSANAWESFDVIDLVLLLTVIAAIGIAVAAMMAQTVALPIAASAITAGLGILSTVLVAYRLLDPPLDASRKFGAFLGLIAAAGVAYGGWLAMQEEAAFTDQASTPGEAPPPPTPGEAPPPPPPPAPPASGGPPPQGPAV